MECCLISCAELEYGLKVMILCIVATLVDVTMTRTLLVLLSCVVNITVGLDCANPGVMMGSAMYGHGNLLDKQIDESHSIFYDCRDNWNSFQALRQPEKCNEISFQCVGGSYSLVNGTWQREKKPDICNKPMPRTMF